MLLSDLEVEDLSVFLVFVLLFTLLLSWVELFDLLIERVLSLEVLVLESFDLVVALVEELLLALSLFIVTSDLSDLVFDKAEDDLVVVPARVGLSTSVVL